MILGPVQVIACPHCGSLAGQQTLISGNTFGAILWTDGKRKAPMLPEFPEVTKCQSCKRFYWVEEAEVKGEIDYDDLKSVPQEWENAEYTRHLTIDEYIEAIDTGVGSNVQKERYLRQHFWWAVNDIVRQNTTKQIPSSYIQKWRENLTKLSVLLNDNDPRDMIIKAEIARETGDFALAISLLEDVPEKLRWVADSIMELAKNQISVVTELRRK